MKIKFSKTTQLSPDGFNVNTYQEGQVYEARSGHEARVFKMAVDKGEATLYGHSEPIAEKKVEIPTETKVATKTTTKTKK